VLRTGMAGVSHGGDVVLESWPYRLFPVLLHLRERSGSSDEYRPLPTRRTVARRPPSPASCTCRAPRPPPSLARPPPLNKSASMVIFSRVHGPVRGATSGSADALWVPAEVASRTIATVATQSAAIAAVSEP
jgi:hypothetical protein